MEALTFTKEGEYHGLLLGDSIINRVSGKQISDNALARGFKGHKFFGLVERVRNNKSRDCKTHNSTNWRLLDRFDAKEAVSNLEKLIKFLNHTFYPRTISVCTVTPLGAFRNDFTQICRKLTNKLPVLLKSVIHIVILQKQQTHAKLQPTKK